MGAYQDTNFAYQGTGIFAYQTAGGVSPAVIIYGDGDARSTRRKRRKKQHDLFEEMESTIRSLLHPDPAPVGVGMAGRADPNPTEECERLVHELTALAQGQHALLQRAAVLKAEIRDLEARQSMELDDEDALIWMF